MNPTKLKHGKDLSDHLENVKNEEEAEETFIWLPSMQIDACGMGAPARDGQSSRASPWEPIDNAGVFPL